MKTEFPEGKDALSEFVLFRDRVYENRSIRWPANLANGLALLMRESAGSEDRTFCPIVVRDGADIVARTVAVLDTRYNRHRVEAVKSSGATRRIRTDDLLITNQFLGPTP